MQRLAFATGPWAGLAVAVAWAAESMAAQVHALTRLAANRQPDRLVTNLNGCSNVLIRHHIENRDWDFFDPLFRFAQNRKEDRPHLHLLCTLFLHDPDLGQMNKGTVSKLLRSDASSLCGFPDKVHRSFDLLTVALPVEREGDLPAAAFCIYRNV